LAGAAASTMVGLEVTATVRAAGPAAIAVHTTKRERRTRRRIASSRAPAATGAAAWPSGACLPGDIPNSQVRTVVADLEETRRPRPDHRPQDPDHGHEGDTKPVVAVMVGPTAGPTMGERQAPAQPYVRGQDRRGPAHASRRPSPRIACATGRCSRTVAVHLGARVCAADGLECASALSTRLRMALDRLRNLVAHRRHAGDRAIGPSVSPATAALRVCCGVGSGPVAGRDGTAQCVMHVHGGPSGSPLASLSTAPRLPRTWRATTRRRPASSRSCATRGVRSLAGKRAAFRRTGRPEMAERVRRKLKRIRDEGRPGEGRPHPVTDPPWDNAPTMRHPRPL
jgi:hypothetical protein